MWPVMVRVGDGLHLLCGGNCTSDLTLGESKFLKALDIETQIDQVDTSLSTFICNRYKVFEVDFLYGYFYY